MAEDSEGSRGVLTAFLGSAIAVSLSRSSSRRTASSGPVTSAWTTSTRRSPIGEHEQLGDARGVGCACTAADISRLWGGARLFREASLAGVVWMFVGGAWDGRPVRVGRDVGLVVPAQGATGDPWL